MKALLEFRARAKSITKIRWYNVVIMPSSANANASYSRSGMPSKMRQVLQAPFMTSSESSHTFQVSHHLLQVSTLSMTHSVIYHSIMRIDATIMPTVACFYLCLAH